MKTPKSYILRLIIHLLGDWMKSELPDKLSCAGGWVMEEAGVDFTLAEIQVKGY